MFCGQKLDVLENHSPTLRIFSNTLIDCEHSIPVLMAVCRPGFHSSRGVVHLGRVKLNIWEWRLVFFILNSPITDVGIKSEEQFEHGGNRPKEYRQRGVRGAVDPGN